MINLDFPLVEHSSSTIRAEINTVAKETFMFPKIFVSIMVPALILWV